MFFIRSFAAVYNYIVAQVATLTTYINDQDAAQATYINEAITTLTAYIDDSITTAIAGKVSYHERGNVAIPDFQLGGLTKDNNFHEMDLSDIVGTGHKLVHLYYELKCNNADKSAFFRCTDYAGAYNLGGLAIQVIGVNVRGNVWVYTDVNGKIEYMFQTGGWTRIMITVCGYFE